MEDSDSEYDPSKIPSNPPSKSTTMAPADITTQAEKDWAFIDNVCGRPIFAQTEDVEKALDLIGNWIDGADARYGAETMTHLRRKIIGPAAEAKRTELRRILELRKQVDPEKTTESQKQSPLTRPTLPPLDSLSRPKSPTISRPMSNGSHVTQHTIQQNGTVTNGSYQHRPSEPQQGTYIDTIGHANGTYTNGAIVKEPQSNGIQTNGIQPNGSLSRPAPHQGTPERRSESRPPTTSQRPQPTPLPPMLAERPQQVYSQVQQAKSQTPAPPVSRGKNWIYSQETDLWCPLCRKGPLSCMHSHRLIGRIFERGIKYSAFEELQFMLQSLEEWAYRGKPLSMEPAMTKLFSLEQLAAEQKDWVAQLRVFLNQFTRPRPREATTPRAQQPPQTVYNQMGSSNRPGPYQEVNGQRYVQGHPPHEAYSRSTPRVQHHTSIPSRNSSVTYTGPSRNLQPAGCNLCPRNHPCIHQGPQQRQVLTPNRSPEQQYVDKKRKYTPEPSGRRVRTAFRAELNHSSSEEEDNIDGLPQMNNEQTYQKFDQVRAMVDAVSKDQLSASILRMCYSNSMVLNCFKKELKRSAIPKEIVVTGESSLITPTSPASSVEKSAASPIVSRAEDRQQKCTRCEATFDALRSSNGECHWHDGDLLRKEQSTSQSNQSLQEGQKIWTCCGSDQSSQGCRTGKHSTAASIKKSPMMSNRTAVASLLDISAGRPAYRQHAHNYSGDYADEFHGQSLVRALAIAERESERAALKQSPISRRASINTVGENDFHALQDFSPLLETLREIPESAFDLGNEFQDTIDLSADPDRHHLHALELRLASRLQLSCARYLVEKRRLFQAFVESMQDGAEFTPLYAEQACKLESIKTRALYSVFERIGWFEPKHFMQYLNDPSGTMLSSIENTQTLPGIHELPHSGLNSAGRPNSAPDTLAQAQLMARRASSGSASAPVIHTHPLDERLRKQRAPMHLPHAASMFRPLHSPSHLHAPHSMTIGHMDQNTVNLTDLPSIPQRDIIMAGSPETYQWRKNVHGKKTQVPICPYPRSWAEADSVDRELVRLKRHEGKQWEELFEWWRAKGRASLKNASCLAVRYSILKKNYEADWQREGL